MKSAKHLSNGSCTGAVLFRAPDGVKKLQVRTGDRGRGLFAASPFKKSDTITTVSGSLLLTTDSSIDNHAEKFQWSKNKFFVMDQTGGLGIYANTAASPWGNNAKYVCNRQNQKMMRLRATRSIAAGQEILVPYGHSYVSRIKNAVKSQQDVMKSRMIDAVQAIDIAAPVVVTGGAVARLLCANCGSKVKANNRRTHARCCSGAIKH
jgi:hypothetical protein